MARACTDINWRYIGDSVPAFLTLAIMPFTYSIAYGLITGIVSYMILNTGAWIIIKVSGGRIVPNDYENKDYWTYKVRGGLLPGWVKRAARGKRDFWRDWNFDAEEVTSRDSYAMSKKGVDRTSAVSAASQGPIGQAVAPGLVVMDGVVTGVVTGDASWMPPTPGYNYRYGNKTDVSVGPLETGPERSNSGSPSRR